MNARRYVVCGVVSVALHSLALSAQQPPPQFALNDSQPGNRVAIQLIAAAPPKPEPVPEPEVQPDPVVQNKPPIKEPPTPEETVVDKPVMETQPKLVEPKPEPKIKPTPTPTKPKKEVKKKEVVKKKPEPKKKEKPEEKQPEEKKQEVTSEVQMNQAKDNAPILVDRPTFKVRPSQPNYPRIAKHKGMQGTVLIEVWLDDQGNQTKQTIAKSSGFDVLDDAAMSAVKKWRFNGHEENGVPLAHRVKIPVRFNLD